VTTIVHGAPEPDGRPREAAQGKPEADGDEAS